MVTVKSLNQGRDWLGLSIKGVFVLIILIALAFGGYYYYERSQQEQSLASNQMVKGAEDYVRKKPRDVNGRVALGRAYLTVERFDDGIEQFDQALKLDKEDQAAIVYKGIAYMEKDDEKKALKQFALEIELYKNAGYAQENNWLEQAYYNSAAILWKQKKYEQALININEAANINRTDADVHFLAGRIFYDKGSYEQASQAFETALSFDINFTDAAYGLGMAYEKMGETGKAAATFRMAEKLKPDFTEAVRSHERLLAKIKSSYEQDSNGARPNYEMGMYYFGQEKYTDARRYLDTAVKAKKDFVLAHFYLGNIEENLNNTDKAIAKYEEVLKLDPEFEKAKQHLEKLREQVVKQ